MTGTKLLAFKGAPASLFEEGKRRIQEYFPREEFDFDSADPILLVFLSGGSEREAVNVMRPGSFVVLAAFEENNSYAAATEVKAYCDTIGQDCRLADLNNESDRGFVRDCMHATNARRKLTGKRLGLIGEISDWLVASDVAADALDAKLGIELVRIPWNDVREYREFEPAPGFLAAFAGRGESNIDDAGRVYGALTDIIAQKRLDAVTVECFSLVKERSVTACLALSRLNDTGIAAGCEGDLASIAGIMLVNEVAGIIPWMANTIKVEGDCAKFAHCTAPTALLSKFRITTHYETGLGTAIRGYFESDAVTIFRLDATLTKAFVTSGTVVSRPERSEACRTQIDVRIPEAAAAVLREKPLGNHHLIVPGDHIGRLNMFCRLHGISLIMERT